MAFKYTSLELDTLLVRDLFVRTRDNVPIASDYALYADGKGGTYWAPTISGQGLSTFSTLIGLDAVGLSTATHAALSTLGGATQAGVASQVSSATASLSTASQFAAAFAALGAVQARAEDLSGGVASAVASLTDSLTSAQVYIEGLAAGAVRLREDLTSTAKAEAEGAAASVRADISGALALLATADTLRAATQDAINRAEAAALLTTVLQTSVEGRLGPLEGQLAATRAALEDLSGGAVASTRARVAAAEGVATGLATGLEDASGRVAALEGALDSVEGRVLERLSTVFDGVLATNVAGLRGDLVAVSSAAGGAQRDVSTSLSLLESAVTLTISSGAAFSGSVSTFSNELSTLRFSSIFAGIYQSFEDLVDYSEWLLRARLSTFHASSLGATQSTAVALAVSSGDAYFALAVAVCLPSTMSTIISTVSTTAAYTLSTSLGSYNEYTTSSIAGIEATSRAVFTAASSTFAGSTNTTLRQSGSTLTALEASTLGGILSIATVSTLAPLYTEQEILLTRTADPTALLDFSHYRNFRVTLSDIAESASLYRLSYHPSTVVGQTYRRGLLLVDVLSTGAYARNEGRLLMDMERLGLPGTIFDALQPTVSCADYLLTYEYSILPSGGGAAPGVFLAFNSIYPRIRLRDAAVATRPTVFDASGSGVGHVPGATLRVTWTYSAALPLDGATGDAADPQGPPFAARVYMDLVLAAEPLRVLATAGPFPLPAGGGDLTLPRTWPQGADPTHPAVPLLLRVFVEGRRHTEAAELPVLLVMPVVRSVTLRSGSQPHTWSQVSCKTVGGVEVAQDAAVLAVAASGTAAPRSAATIVLDMTYGGDALASQSDVVLDPSGVPLRVANSGSAWGRVPAASVEGAAAYLSTPATLAGGGALRLSPDASGCAGGALLMSTLGMSVTTLWVAGTGRLALNGVLVPVSDSSGWRSLWDTEAAQASTTLRVTAVGGDVLVGELRLLPASTDDALAAQDAFTRPRFLALGAPLLSHQSVTVGSGMELRLAGLPLDRDPDRVAAGGHALSSIRLTVPEGAGTATLVLGISSFLMPVPLPTVGTTFVLGLL